MVEIVLEELLPRDGAGRVEVQAAAAFLGRAVLHPEIATVQVARAAVLTGYLADGLIAHTLTGRQTAASARAILDVQLDRIFG